MNGSLVLLITMLLVGNAYAQQDPGGAMTVDKLKELNARQVPVDELRTLAGGAKVTHTLVNGSTRVWTNNPDGSIGGLITNRAGYVGPSSASGGSGTWSVDEKGQFCFKAQWNYPRGEDSYCRAMFQVGSKYYGANISSMSKPGTFVGAYEFSGVR